LQTLRVFKTIRVSGRKNCTGYFVPNPYGKRGGGSLTVCMHYVRDKKMRLLYCRTCRARFSERKGTALFRPHLPEDKAGSVPQHIQEGCGVRKTARLTGVNRDTAF